MKTLPAILLGLAVGFGVGVLGSAAYWGDSAGSTGQRMLTSLSLVGHSTVALEDSEVEPTAEEHGGSDIADMFDQMWHPSDPARPSSTLGMTDDELLELPREEWEFLLTEGVAEVRQESPAVAHHLFALGRLAFLRKRDELARELLQEAERVGSAGAGFYLAQLAMQANDEKAALVYVDRAIKGGFKPAGEIRGEIETQAKLKHVDYDTLQLGDLVRALRDGDMAKVNENRLWNLVAVKSMAAAIAAAGENGLLLTDQQQLIQLDAGLPAAANFEYNRPENQMAMMKAGWDNMLGAMSAGLDTFQKTQTKRGDDPVEAILGVFGGILAGNHELQRLPMLIHTIEAKGTVDGQTLARAYRSGARDEVAAIYLNMQRFVYRR